jgi:hypothetical protein
MIGYSGVSWLSPAGSIGSLSFGTAGVRQDDGILAQSAERVILGVLEEQEAQHHGT